MKRHLLGIFLFLLVIEGAYLLYSYSYYFRSKPTAQPQATKPAIPEPVATNDFVPEFINLPTFDESGDKYAERQKYKTKLISIKEFFNPDHAASIYNKSELNIKGGEDWLAFSIGDDGNTSLKSIQVNAKLEPKIKRIINEPQFSLSFDLPSTPAFIIKGSKHVKQGKVTSLFNTYSPQTSYEELSLGYKRMFNLNGKDYVLRVTSGLQKDGVKVNVLVLETNDTSQIVTYNDYYNDSDSRYETIGELLWVGDLDNDKKIDLYISHFNFEKGGFEGSLFLSSEAEPDKLVKESAYFAGGGC